MIKSFMKKSNRIVVITGASHGIGYAALELFRKQGDIVYDLSRTSGTDITDIQAVRQFFEKIYAEHGRIDVLINNAGYGISGSAECTKPEDIKKMFDVNFVGLATCCSIVLPYMRVQMNFPIIINISSVAGVYALPFQAIYSASKSAVIGYTNALRTEIKPFKIRACSVLLGDVKTNFTNARKKNEDDDLAYKDNVKKAMKRYEADETKGYSPKFVARKLYKLSYRKRPAPVITFGALFKFLVFLNRIFPLRFMNWMVGKIYKQ